MGSRKHIMIDRLVHIPSQILDVVGEIWNQTRQLLANSQEICKKFVQNFLSIRERFFWETPSLLYNYRTSEILRTTCESQSCVWWETHPWNQLHNFSLNKCQIQDYKNYVHQRSIQILLCPPEWQSYCKSHVIALYILYFKYMKLNVIIT